MECYCILNESLLLRVGVREVLRRGVLGGLRWVLGGPRGSGNTPGKVRGRSEEGPEGSGRVWAGSWRSLGGLLGCLGEILRGPWESLRESGGLEEVLGIPWKGLGGILKSFWWS